MGAHSGSQYGGSSHGRKGVAAADVLGFGDGFKVVWVEAVVDAAEVVKFEAVWDRTDEEFVDKAMPGPALPVHPCPDVSAF